ncbi:MAG: C13 family peptidase [Candidatus Thiodiazotropha sp. (ex Epidulcina cf. delphinae)]|nr:C13 family peptidase [Candidatus Thiodiazotropha sp. (ex Epidulcina cf. delphinae)]
MEANPIGRHLNALLTNLQAGLRLTTGQPVTRNNFVYSLDQGLWLIAGLILLEIAVTYLTSDKPAIFSGYGLNYLGAIYLLDLTILMLIARLAGASLTHAGHLLIAYLACTPLIVVTIHLITLPEDWLLNQPQSIGLLWLVLLAWQVYILLRLLRIILTIDYRKALFLAGLNTLLSLSSLWFLPQTELWYSDNPADEENAYAELNRLSVEDLFYEQYHLVDTALDDLTPQRPGIPDLYLVALGGYGLEKVFLNEVEYVRSLFDQRFDTVGRSVVLANNIETTSHYPMANRHNLADTLTGIGQLMDPQEDLLFLFMTSHGSSDHRFSVDFGPVPLDDLTPVQVRQALDDAGIRWRVIVVSSCYSGGFIEPLRSPDTLIITASASDRQSFGCGAKSEFTDFGTAYFKHALAQQPNFIEAFDIASKWVEEKERRERREPSMPQRFVGEAMREKLAIFNGGAYNESSLSRQAGQSGECGPWTGHNSCSQD